MKFVFAGDSLTDMGRKREYDDSFPFALGNGFVFFAADLLYEDDTNNKVINRGISGDKITDLDNRFDRDIVSQNADVVTILIGVNDIWHYLDHLVRLIPLDEWEQIYQSFIDRLRKKNNNVRIIMMEPFYLPGSCYGDKYDDFALLKDYQKRAYEIAKKNNVDFVPLQNKLTEYGKKIGYENVLYDGIHSNVLGSKYIADEWFKVYKKR